MRFHLLQCLARAIVKNGIKFVCNLVPGGGPLYEIVDDAWKDYRQDHREDALRAEVQGLAQAPVEQVRQEVEAAVGAEAAGQSAEVRQAIVAYMTQVPAMIRRSLRRPGDPSGTTVPVNLALNQPEDLLQFLPPRPPRFKPGDRPLPGVDWVLEESLGGGGFGEVWKARHPRFRNMPPVALKFCLDGSAEKALENEAGVHDWLMGQGKHPGIVELRHVYLSANPPCLEYEYVEGGDLGELIRERHAENRMTPDAASRLLLRLAEIVAHAHQADPPIVHDDLKPANILVQRGEEGKEILRLTDFGIGGLATVRVVSETRQPTRSRHELLTDAVHGAYTPLYASPEQMARTRREPADPRDDVHALGVIWYQLLTGDLGILRLPAEWRDQVEERGLGSELVRLLASCMASRAEKRPASAVVLVQRLRELVYEVETPSAGDEKARGEQRRQEAAEQDRQHRATAQVQSEEETHQLEPPLQLIGSVQELLTSLGNFNREATAHPERACNVMRRTSYWVYDPDLEAFGPSKFVAFARMTFQRYELAGSDNLFNGTTARTQIEAVLGREFVERPNLHSSLREWAKRVLCQEAVFEGIDQTKWWFISTAGEQSELTHTTGQELSEKRHPGQLVTISLAAGIDMKFAWCPPGTFLMGSPAGEESRDENETQHRVTLTKGFYLDVHQVTQALWQAVMGSNPSILKGDERPVENVSWDDCQEFCKQLGAKTGKQFRLPTEAEWEYACRAGTTTPFSFGATISTDQANYDGNYTYGAGKKGVYRKQTTPVGSFPANAWGMHDMHGNVWEWCQDWFDAYSSEDIKEPKDSNNREAHVLRGGCWRYDPRMCRSASRRRNAPDYRSVYCGCRVVLCLD